MCYFIKAVDQTKAFQPPGICGWGDDLDLMGTQSSRLKLLEGLTLAGMEK